MPLRAANRSHNATYCDLLIGRMRPIHQIRPRVCPMPNTNTHTKYKQIRNHSNLISGFGNPTDLFIAFAWRLTSGLHSGGRRWRETGKLNLWEFFSLLWKSACHIYCARCRALRARTYACALVCDSCDNEAPRRHFRCVCFL